MKKNDSANAKQRPALFALLGALLLLQPGCYALELDGFQGHGGRNNPLDPQSTGDYDRDGVADVEDSKPFDAAEWADSDGVPDAIDNCQGLNNPDQVDADGDGLGDACDNCNDMDHDGYGKGPDCLAEDCDDSNGDLTAVVCGDGQKCSSEDCDLGADNSDAGDSLCRTDCSFRICAEDSCGVHEICSSSQGVLSCTCEPGWELNADGNGCDDVDECATRTDNCDDNHGSCTNTPGSFSCACDSGWVLSGDGHSCGDTQCVGVSDGSPCTDPDRDFNVCVGEHCVSPGCGDASCNLTQSFSLADTGLLSCYGSTDDTNNDTELTSCPGVAGDESCGATLYCGQDAQYGDGGRDRFTRDLTNVPNEPTVTDSISGLMWQGCSAGLSGENCATGSAQTYTWSEALDYCELLDWGGHSDWRLPGDLELLSIVDYSASFLAIDNTAFPATPLKWFWSSTTAAWGGDLLAWYVYFYDGSGHYDYKTVSNNVRCVRLGS